MGGSISSCARAFAARVGAAALAVPMLFGGALPASAAIVSHPMVPAVSNHIRYQYAGSAAALGQTKFACQVPGLRPVLCYGPDQIRSAYGIRPLLDSGITGAGHTIVIIDAFQSPTIKEDLALFDKVWGYPDPTFKIFAPDGLTPFDPNNGNQVGWSAEISLDVQWAHAIAPGAAIDLVLARSNQDADMLSATKYAVQHRLGDVISQSFGEAETCMDPKLLRQQHKLFELASGRGITLIASAGDQGAAQATCDSGSFMKSASTPASDPNVTGVGGTSLVADATSGAYQSESVWNDEFGAGGGGFSTVYKRPAYQAGVIDNAGQRGVPDVTYNGDLRGGVVAAWGVPFGVGGFFLFGGTSAGAPQWAGIVALANQKGNHRLGAINDALYDIANSEQDYGRAFHDITAGNNGCTITVCGIAVSGYSAKPRWDAASGLGSPKAANLIGLLLNMDAEGEGGGGSTTQSG